MAPQLIKYIEKTNVSSDTQLCDSVKSAITTAMMDPEVINSTNAAIPSGSGWTDVSGGLGGGDFETAVEEILGCADTAIDGKIKSTTASGKVQFQIVNSNSVWVQITNSDNRGKKDTTGTYNIFVD